MRQRESELTMQIGVLQAGSAASAGPGMGVLNELAKSQKELVDALKVKEQVRLVDNKGLGKPEKFDGQAEKFLPWKIKISSYLGSIRRDLREVLSWAEEIDVPIDDASVDTAFGATADAIDQIEGIHDLRKELWSALLMTTEREPFDIVLNSGDCGLEAWRRLTKRFDPSTGGRKRALLNSILSPNRSKLDELPQNLERLLDTIRLYERRRDASGNRSVLPEDIKVNILERLVPTELERHLVLNRDRFKTFESMIGEIQSYVEHATGNRIRVYNSQSNHDPHGRGDDPMDVSSFSKSKGKGKKGGKSNNKGNGDKKVCYNCGKPGHMKAECWAAGGGKAKDAKGSKSSGSKGGDNKGKGGKPKGKGKGGKGVNNFEQGDGEAREPEEENWDAQEWNDGSGQASANGLTLFGLTADDGAEDEGEESEMTVDSDVSVETSYDVRSVDPIRDRSRPIRLEPGPGADRSPLPRRRTSALKSPATPKTPGLNTKTQLKRTPPRVEKTMSTSSKGKTTVSVPFRVAESGYVAKTPPPRSRRFTPQTPPGLGMPDASSPVSVASPISKPGTPPGPPPPDALGPNTPPGPPPGWSPPGPKAPPVAKNMPVAPGPKAAATSTGSVTVQMLKSALFGQYVDAVGELEGEDHAKARATMKALASRGPKAPPITSENINDSSFHDSRYHRAIAAGTPHHKAWRAERQRRRAIVNRRAGVKERAAERIHLDREWHRRFDNPASSSGPQHIEDEDNLDADIETEVVGKAEKTRGVTELGSRERKTLQQFPMDEQKVLSSDPKKKVVGPRVRSEEYRKKKNAARNKARKGLKRKLKEMSKKEEDDEEDEAGSPGPPDEPRDRPGGHGDGPSGGSALAVCSLASNEAGTNGSWNGWKYMELNIDTGAAITAIPVEAAQGYPCSESNGLSYRTANGESIADQGCVKLKGMDARGNVLPIEGRVTEVHRALLAGSDVAKSHHVALGPRGGRLIPRNTEAGRAYSRMMKELIQKYGDEMPEVHNRKGIYVMDCWMTPPLKGQPSGA